MAEQQKRMLDVKHFHVVFTLPAELRPLAAFAKDAIYGALFRAASSTLLEFEERRLSATIGATLVLHTWTRDLRFHPHVHAIVTGGGLSRNGQQWRSVRRDYLFSVHRMSRVFRGKMIDELKHAYKDGEFSRFSDFDDPEAFSRLVNTLWKRPWVVYAKPTFSKGEHVLKYLGRYTHRLGTAACDFHARWNQTLAPRCAIVESRHLRSGNNTSRSVIRRADRPTRRTESTKPTAPKSP